MSARRRVQLLEFAERSRAWILEDDYDGEFFVGSVPHLSLRSMDSTDRVIHIGTFSKSLASGIRLGFLVLPRALVSVVTRLRYLEGQHGSQLEQLALADFIGRGAFSRHVATMKRIYERRRRLLLDRLGGTLPRGVELRCTKGALHGVLHLPRAVDDEQLARSSAEVGLDVRPLSPLFLQVERRRPGLLLGLGAASDTLLARACETLGAQVQEAVRSAR